MASLTLVEPQSPAVSAAQVRLSEISTALYQIEDAHKNRDHLLLGHQSWEAYIQAELPPKGLKLLIGESQATASQASQATHKAAPRLATPRSRTTKSRTNHKPKPTAKLRPGTITHRLAHATLKLLNERGAQGITKTDFLMQVAVPLQSGGTDLPKVANYLQKAMDQEIWMYVIPDEGSGYHWVLAQFKDQIPLNAERIKRCQAGLQ